MEDRFQFKEITRLSNHVKPIPNFLSFWRLFLDDVVQCPPLPMCQVEVVEGCRKTPQQTQRTTRTASDLTKENAVAAILCGSSKGIKESLLPQVPLFSSFPILYSPVPSSKPALIQLRWESHFDNEFWMTLNFSANLWSFVFFDSLARIDKSDQRTGI